MRNMRKMSLVMFLAGFVMIVACSKEKNQYGEVIPRDAVKVTMSELLKNAKAYDGQMVAVDGSMGDMCADGDDFFFKDRFDLIEVIPPPGEALPYKSRKGSPMTVYGKVKVRGGEEEAHEEVENHGEEEEESEVEIVAKGVLFK